MRVWRGGQPVSAAAASNPNNPAMPLSVDPSLYNGSNFSSPSPARSTPSGSPGPSPRHTHHRLSIARTPSSSPQLAAADTATPLSKSSASATLSPRLPVPLLSRLLRPRTFAQRALTLALCTVGIYVCFLSYAVLQERMSVNAAHQLSFQLTEHAADCTCLVDLTAAGGCVVLCCVAFSYKRRYGEQQEQFQHASAAAAPVTPHSLLVPHCMVKCGMSDEPLSG